MLINGIPLELLECYTLAMDGVKVSRSRIFRFKMECRIADDAEIDDIISGLQRAMRQQFGFRLFGFKREFLYLLRLERTGERNPERTVASDIVFIANRHIEVLIACFLLFEIYIVPEVGFRSLVISDFPIELDSRATAGAFCFFREADFNMNILGRYNTYPYLIAFDILEKVTRQLLAVCASCGNRDRAVLILQTVRTLEAYLAEHSSFALAEVMNIYGRVFLQVANLGHIHMIPNRIIRSQAFAVFPVELNSVLTLRIHILLLCCRCGSSPYLEFLIGLHAYPNRIRCSGIERIGEGMLDWVGAGSYRMREFLHIDIRAGEGQRYGYRCFTLTHVLRINGYILHIGFRLGHIYGIPLGGISLLLVTCSPVEIDVRLAVLTFAHMFETGVAYERLLCLDQQIHTMHAGIQSFEHIALEYYNLRTACRDIVVGLRGAVCLAFECHEGGHLNSRSSGIEERELGFEILHRFCLLYADIVESAGDGLSLLLQLQFGCRCYLAVKDRSGCRLRNGINLQRQGLVGCDTSVELIYIERTEVTSGHHACYRIACAYREGARGQTGRRAVERYAGCHISCLVTAVGDGQLYILLGGLFEFLDVHFPPCIPCYVLGSRRLPAQLCIGLTALIEVCLLKYFRA